MKKFLIAIMLFSFLSACDDAKKAADQVQEAVQSFDMESLNLDQFGGAAEQAKALALSVQDAINVDLSNPDAVNKVKDSIANAYSCMADKSSDEQATDLVNTLIEKVKNEDVMSLIKQAVEQGASVTQCMTN
ncbi:hypothetical protein E2K93_00415 [Thalassotalea sp. HSM 43]|uniref:hypothetical protein n=1 Tax=Thalassotalea sp. HSM 43 TaxID=2552945 RepID=UPI001081CF28|nr:hypothetical protein [Thalassotalea sp. HSM 43]QBY02925.1 hypothetical protein E2K93_00415 [Thalassotalea sp. HSM 43]